MAIELMRTAKVTDFFVMLWRTGVLQHLAMASSMNHILDYLIVISSPPVGKAGGTQWPPNGRGQGLVGAEDLRGEKVGERKQELSKWSINFEANSHIVMKWP